MGGLKILDSHSTACSLSFSVSPDSHSRMLKSKVKNTHAPAIFTQLFIKEWLLVGYSRTGLEGAVPTKVHTKNCYQSDTDSRHKN